MTTRLPILLTCISLASGLYADSRLISILEPIFTTPAPFTPEGPTPEEPESATAATQAAAAEETAQEPVIAATAVEVVAEAPAAAMSAPSQPVAASAPKAPPEPPKYFLEEQELVETLHHSLQEAYRPEGELEIQLSRSWTPLPLPQQGWSIRMIHGISDALASYMTIRFEVLSGPVTLGPFVTGIRCALWQEGWVSRTENKRGQALEPESFQPKRVDALRARGNLVSMDLAFDQFELARRLPANRPLTQGDIMPKPLVRRGDIFDVIAEEGNLHISMKAMALENGLEGDIIQVRNLTSNKIIHARITPEKKGKVSF